MLVPGLEPGKLDFQSKALPIKLYQQKTLALIMFIFNKKFLLNYLFFLYKLKIITKVDGIRTHEDIYIIEFTAQLL